MKKITLLFTLFFLFSACSKIQNQYDEKNPQGFTPETPFKYFSMTIEEPEKVFEIDQNSLIGPKERAKFKSYSRIYFTADGTEPIRIENYRQHNFNNHLYYAYKILDIRKDKGVVQVIVTEQEWDENIKKLIVKNMMTKSFESEKTMTIQDIVASYKANPADMGILNKVIKINFVTKNTDENKKTLQAVASDKSFLTVEGYDKAFPEVDIRLYFFDEKRGNAAILGNFFDKPVPMIAKLSKVTSERLHFTYIDFDPDKVKLNSDGSIEIKEEAMTTGTMYSTPSGKE
ncbi:MAG TPA: hypothetical protein DHW82_00670 [Spirochaetia bacterium]|nr:MAG: hypothetical protein A2Y41_13435 [Spirochaetes bacterium GWB1_36_13]HCL55513.1 hypothetical protein [Spirochaetia bacterium]